MRAGAEHVRRGVAARERPARPARAIAGRRRLVRGLAIAPAFVSLAAPAPVGASGRGEGGTASPPTDAWAQAVRHNDTARLAALLPGRRDIDRPLADGKTALMAAAAGGDTVLLERLLAAGADPSALNAKGASALFYAAWGGNPGVMRALLARRPAIDRAASNGWTALTMAAAKGHVEAVRQLLAAGARVDPPDVRGWTPLMRATDLGRVHVAEVLVVEGHARLDAINTAGMTALHIAAAAGQPVIYQRLLALGADPRRVDFSGLSAEAIRSGSGRRVP